MALNPNDLATLIALGGMPQRAPGSFQLAAGLPMTMGPGPGEEAPPESQDIPRPAPRPQIPVIPRPGVPQTPGIIGAPTLPPAPQPPPPMPPMSGFSREAAIGGAAYGTPWDVSGSVGGNVANIPMPIPRPPGAEQPTGAPTSGGAQGGPGLQRGLSEALRGVQAMQPPTAQTVRTPPPPAIRPTSGTEFINMLASLGIGPQEFMRMQGMRFGR